jgi:hypothetical protein
VGLPFAITLTASNLTGALPTTAQGLSGPGAVFTPGTATPAPGELTKLFSAVFDAAGTAQVRATAAAGAVVSNTLAISVLPASPPPPPPPPPPPTGTIVAATLLPSSSGTVPFAFGQAFKRGHLPAGTQLAGLQLTRLRAWSDGSCKFGLVAGSATMTAGQAFSVAMVAGAALTGTDIGLSALQAAMSAPVTIGAGAFGSATWSGGDWLSPHETLVIGPAMSSWRFRKPVGTDAHLVAWLEVRMWAGGAVEVLPWVENGYTLVAGPGARSATYSFTLGGTQRFSAAIDLLHHQRTPLVSGTATAHWLGTAHETAIKPDGQYLMSTDLVPPYFADTAASAASVTGLPASFTPLQQGDFPVGMGAPGYHRSIGLLPEWDVVHLTSAAVTGTFRGMVFNAYSAGRYGMHYRSETTQRPAQLSNHPTLNFIPPQSGWTTTPATTGANPPGFTASHHPSVGFLAYLVTGRRYHLETLQFAVSFLGLLESSTQRQGGLGLYKTTAAGAARHVAWCLRSLAQAIAIVPDAETAMLAEYRTQYSNNIDYYHARYVAQPHNPQGFVTPYSDTGHVAGTVLAGATSSVIQVTGAGGTGLASGQYVGNSITIGSETRTVAGFNAATLTFTTTAPFSSAPAAGALYVLADNKCFDQPWMTDFLSASMGYGKSLELGLSAPTQAKFDAFYAWQARSVVGRFGGLATSDYLYREYATRNICVAPFDAGSLPSSDARWDNGTGPWHADWGAVYTATFSGATPAGASNAAPPYAAPGPRVDGPIRDVISAEFPAAEAIPALSYAARHRLPGAVAALSLLLNAPNWYELETMMDSQPVWAVSHQAGPRWWRGVAPGQAVEIQGTNLGLAAPSRGGTIRFGGGVANGGGSAFGFRKDAYCGMGFDAVLNRIISGPNGGHGDYWGNEIPLLRLEDDAPAWAELAPGSGAESWPAINAPTTRMGFTLTGCTSSVLRIFGTNPVLNGHDVIVGGQTRTVLSTDVAARTITLSSPLSAAPGAGVEIQLMARVRTSAAGSTASTLALNASAPVMSGMTVTVAGETRAIASSSSGTSIALSTPLSAAPAAGVAVTINPEVNHQHPDIGYLAQILTRYPDRLPVAVHSYYGQQVIDRQRLYLTTNGSVAPSGSGSDVVEAYDLDQTGNAGWLEYGSWPNLLGGVNGGLTVAIVPAVTKDPTTGTVLAVMSQVLSKLTPNPSGKGATRSTVALPGAFNPGAYVSMAVDTRQNRLFWCHPAAPHTIDLASNTVVARTLTGDSGLLAEFAALGSEGLGIDYVPRQNAFYVRARAAGTKVYRIDAVSWALTLASAPALPASTGSSSPGGHGIYNGWRFSARFRGFIYMPSGGANVWFWRVY